MAEPIRAGRFGDGARWVGSIGIFYVLLPAAWIAGGLFLDRLFLADLLPVDPVGVLGWGRYPLGALSVVCGASLAVAAMVSQVRQGRGHPLATHGQSDAARPTTTLVTAGVYYWSRNPMNLGDLLLYSGLSLLVGSTAGLLINLPLYTFVILFNARYLERRGLIERFGDQYLSYERTTSALVPGLRTLRKLIAPSHQLR